MTMADRVSLHRNKMIPTTQMLKFCEFAFATCTAITAESLDAVEDLLRARRITRASEKFINHMHDPTLMLVHEAAAETSQCSKNLSTVIAQPLVRKHIACGKHLHKTPRVISPIIGPHHGNDARLQSVEVRPELKDVGGGGF